MLWPPVGSANLQLPCGTCVGCRQRRAKEWATRAVHEAAQHEFNSFVTLTYDAAHLPEGGDLVPRHLQLFLKRVRNAARKRRGCPGLLGSRLRFLACGEYGETGGRPHYHAILFGVSFSDGVKRGRELFSSRCLSSLWPLGDAQFGTVTGASAAYVAQYSLKKQSRREWSEFYGDGIVKQPPFLRCSLRPGIGAQWLKRYAQDTRYGFVVVDGVKYAVPRYYQKLLDVTDVGLAEESRENAAMSPRVLDARPDGLAIAEAIELRRRELMDPRKFNL